MNLVTRYYFDHNATTPVSPEVFQAMAPLMTTVFGNASSIHQFGQEARGELDRARRSVAAMLGAKAEEIIFTGGGTEADNMAIFGAGGHVITTTVEHPVTQTNTVTASTVTQTPAPANQANEERRTEAETNLRKAEKENQELKRQVEEAHP